MDINKNIKFHILIFIFGFLSLTLLSGCLKKDDLGQAQSYAGKSEIYSQRAVEKYKGLIREGKDLDKAHFELGRLYYSRGEFDKAQEELKKTNSSQANKLLAISYYRTGNFTDALEVFTKNEIADDEYLYHHGLTCEKLNLFDKALDIYKKIKGGGFSPLSLLRLNIIEKQADAIHIQDINPQVNEIIKTAPLPDAYPQAGALILFCDEKIELTGQDTQITYVHYIVKILNERGKENFSETQIEYDSTYDKIELEYARTINPDGRVIGVGTRHIRDVSKYLNFPLYSNARLYIISFPEISEGAVVEYKLKIYRNQLMNKKDFVISYPVQALEPIIAANFTIDLPRNKTLHIKTLNDKYNNFNADLKPKIKEEAGRLIYRWEFKGIPQIMPEPNMPPSVKINPAILISTFESWQEVYQWWRALSQDKIKADAAIRSEVNELIKAQDSGEAKMRAIYNFCAKEIRYVAVEYGQAGYQPHNAADIFKNKYGDCKDQAILLVTMLKEAGFLAWPVLISTEEYYNLNTDFPGVLFNHCIAAVLLGDRTIFLDPTCETCSFGDLPSGDQDRQVLVFKEDKYEIQNTPLYPAGHNLIKQNLKVKINKDESISANKEIFTHGIYEQAQRYWLLYTPPQLIGEALKEKIQEGSIGATLDGYNIRNLENLNEPVALSYEFHGPEYFTVAGKLRVLPQLASLDAALVAKEKRLYPIDFGVLDSKETTVEIEVPDNFTIKYIPDTVMEDNPWFKFTAEYSRKDNKLLFRQAVELNKKIVPEPDYPDFKVFFEKLAKRIKQRVILERIK